VRDRAGALPTVGRIWRCPGKRAIAMEVFELAMPDAAASGMAHGRLAYWSNDLLRDLAGPELVDTEHAKEFLREVRDLPSVFTGSASSGPPLEHGRPDRFRRRTGFGGQVGCLTDNGERYVVRRTFDPVGRGRAGELRPTIDAEALYEKGGSSLTPTGSQGLE